MASLLYGPIEMGGNSSQPYSIFVDLADGRDFGDPVPVTSTVESLYTDGSFVTGLFSDNRQVQLRVKIQAATRATLRTLTDALAAQVDLQVNTLQWTPSDGLPQILDLYRGHMQVTWTGTWENHFRREVLITVAAAPFWRTPGSLAITIASSTVTIESFEGTLPTYTRQPSGGGGYAAGTASATTSSRATSGSKVWDSTDLGNAVGRLVSSTFTAIDISAMTNVRLDLVYENGIGAGGTVTLTLKDGTHTVAVSGTVVNYDGVVPGYVLWSVASFSAGGLTLTHVTGYQIDWTLSFGGSGYGTAELQLDNLSGIPLAAPADSLSGYGQVYRVTGLAGSARSPIGWTAANAGGIESLIVATMPDPTQGPNIYGAPSTPTLHNLSGTFLILAIVTTDGAPTPPAAWTMTVTESDSTGGSSIDTAVSYNHLGTMFHGVAGSSKILNYGTVDLPLQSAGPVNTSGRYLSFAQSGTGLPTLTAIVLIDVRAGLVIAEGMLNPTSGSGGADVASQLPAVPGIDTQPLLYGSSSGANVVSLKQSLMRTSNALVINPTDAKILVFAAQGGAPTFTLIYSPRWLGERIS